MREMTKKPPSGLAASGHADDSDPDQITKEHNDEGQDINIDPSEDVTVEAAEDVTTEAASRTPDPSLRPDAADGTPAPHAPTLMGVPIQSLPLPGVTAASLNEDETRTIDYDEEITVLAQAAPRLRRRRRPRTWTSCTTWMIRSVRRSWTTTRKRRRSSPPSRR